MCIRDRRMPFSADGGAISGEVFLTKGDYSQDINELLDAVNQKMNSYDLHFTIDPDTQLVQLTFAGTFIADYVSIPHCGILTLLGFDKGICLYRTGGAPGSIPEGLVGYELVATAPFPYKDAINRDLVLRIADVECIMSSDSVCNRASAVLLASTPSSSVIESPNLEFELLQIQSRLQTLRIEMLDVYGNPYDFGTEGASFLLDFYCYRDLGPVTM